LYGPARTKPGPITEVACWPHTRRGFFDEWEQHKSPTAKAALDRIGAIYAIEARAAFAPIHERIEQRRELAPLLDTFFAWAETRLTKLSAKAKLAEAFRYALNRRGALSRFVTDGRLEIDNNMAENAMRCVALGRKNYLFAGSDAGGDRAAAIYTIVRTAKLNGLNPETYLRDLLTKIGEGHTINKIDELLPWSIEPKR
jgi:transposase